MIENAKVVTHVYQSKLREDIISALTDNIRVLEGYQSQYLNKTLRLCFSSQKELYSIFTKIFGKPLLSNHLIAKVRDKCVTF
jgi:hypothetical protein